jgi:hypothetical protein
MERRRRRKKEERKEGSCSGILMMLLNVAWSTRMVSPYQTRSEIPLLQQFRFGNFLFVFVNVDGNGVLHYSSSSPKSNRQGSLFSFLLPKSFAPFCCAS